MRRHPQCIDGVRVGLAAATLSTLTLLAAGAVSGRGLHILADAGMAALPPTVRAVTGASAALSYVLSHTAVYMPGGVVALALAGLADRLPTLVTGLVFAVIMV